VLVDALHTKGLVHVPLTHGILGIGTHCPLTHSCVGSAHGFSGEQVGPGGVGDGFFLTTKGTVMTMTKITAIDMTMAAMTPPDNGIFCFKLRIFFYCVQLEQITTNQ
jgi:hypothetical protein